MDILKRFEEIDNYHTNWKEGCAEIAWEFAEKFALWVDENYVCFQGKYNKRTDPYWNTNNLTITEVLENYRKENIPINTNVE